MGAGHSTSRANAVLDLMSKTMVQVQSACIAEARDQALIQVGRAKNFTMLNDHINQSATAAASCSSKTHVDVGDAGIQNQLKEQLNAMFSGTNGNGATSSSIAEEISKSITKKTISSCVAQSVNVFKAEFGKVGGDFNVNNFNLNQVAESEIKKCIMNSDVKVGNVPLMEYLKTNLNGLDINPGISAPGSDETIRCELIKPYKTATYASVSIAFIILFICLVAAIILLLTK